MNNVKVEIKGLGKLDDALRKAPVFTLNEISKAVQKSALTVQNNAIKESPVNKQTGGGNLRQNIRMTMETKTRAAVISKAPYSIFVEEGTRPHEIKVKYKKVLANKRTGQVFGKVVHHPGTRANPYMQRALTGSKQAIDEFFKKAVLNIIKSLKV